MMIRLLGFVLRDIARGKWVLLYLGFFLVATEGLLFFTAGEAKPVVGLMNIILMLIPLAALMFGTLHVHNSRDFIELMLSQPVKRSTIYTALYLGVVLPFMGAFVLGVGIPAAAHGMITSLPVLTLLGTGCALTMVFFAISFWVAIAVDDKAASMGLAFMLWLGLAVLYDGLVLAVTVWYADYPLETATIAMVVLNPIDLARIVVMLTFDYATLMGYTGAVFAKFFGSATGIMISIAALGAWTAFPFMMGMRAFGKKDW